MSDSNVRYSVKFKNESTNSGKVMLFQKDPDIEIPNVMSLAWFVKSVHPGTEVVFDWGINYNFVWSETGELHPGVRFKATQTPTAGLTDDNQITLTHEQDAYNFVNQRKGIKEGSLYIDQDANVPLKQASVGIGMSNAGTFAVQAQPNMNLTFTPHPQYWIAFGNFEQGQVLDIQQVTNDHQIDFSPNVYSYDVALTRDNKWKV